MATTEESLYEQVLVTRCQLGDDAAFAELFEIYGPRLLLFAQRMMRSWPQDVPDVMQETWIEIYRHLPRLLEPAKFRPWAFRIARDRIYREYRRRKLPLLPLEETQLAETPEENTSDLDREALEKCLTTLSPEHRETLVLRYFEEMSYDEIARVTGSSLGTVRSRIHYGKQALQKLWKGKSYEK